MPDDGNKELSAMKTDFNGGKRREKIVLILFTFWRSVNYSE